MMSLPEFEVKNEENKKLMIFGKKLEDCKDFFDLYKEIYFFIKPITNFFRDNEDFEISEDLISHFLEKLKKKFDIQLKNWDITLKNFFNNLQIDEKQIDDKNKFDLFIKMNTSKNEEEFTYYIKKLDLDKNYYKRPPIFYSEISKKTEQNLNFFYENLLRFGYKKEFFSYNNISLENFDDNLLITNENDFISTINHFHFLKSYDTILDFIYLFKIKFTTNGIFIDINFKKFDLEFLDKWRLKKNIIFTKNNLEISKDFSSKLLNELLIFVLLSFMFVFSSIFFLLLFTINIKYVILFSLSLIFPIIISIFLSETIFSIKKTEEIENCIYYIHPSILPIIKIINIFSFKTFKNFEIRQEKCITMIDKFSIIPSINMSIFEEI